MFLDLQFQGDGSSCPLETCCMLEKFYTVLRRFVFLTYGIITLISRCILDNPDQNKQWCSCWTYISRCFRYMERQAASAIALLHFHLHQDSCSFFDLHFLNLSLITLSLLNVSEHELNRSMACAPISISTPPPDLIGSLRHAPSSMCRISTKRL